MTIQSKPWFNLSPIPNLLKHTPDNSSPAQIDGVNALIQAIETSLLNSDGRWIRNHSLFSNNDQPPSPAIQSGGVLHRELPISLGTPAAKIYLDQPHTYLNHIEKAGAITGLYQSAWMLEGAAGLLDTESYYARRGEHYKHCHELVEQATTQLKASTKKTVGDPNPERRPRVILMGTGAGLEHDLRKLANEFAVTIVDINQFLLETTLANLPESLKPYVSAVVEDITGGDVTRVVLGANEILDHPITSKSFSLTMDKLASYFEKAAVSSIDFSKFDGDLIISSLLITQTTVYLEKQIWDTLNERHETNLISPTENEIMSIERFKKAFYAFSSKIQQAHSNALEAAIRNCDEKLACYISDVAGLDRYKPVTKNEIILAPEDIYADGYPITDFFVNGVVTYIDAEVSPNKENLTFKLLTQYEAHELSALFHMNPHLNIVSGKNWKEHHSGAEASLASELYSIEITDTNGVSRSILAYKGTYRLMSGVVIQGRKITPKPTKPSFWDSLKKLFGLS